MARFVVDFGEGLANFFSNDLQNIYYRFLFRRLMYKRVAQHKFEVDEGFRCQSIRYWRDLGVRIDPIWHDFYSWSNGIRDYRYLPENFYYWKVEPYLNRKSFTKAIDDKNYYSLIFAGFRTPDVVFRNISGIFYSPDYVPMSENDAYDALIGKGEVVFKPSIDGSGGNRISFVESGEVSSEKFSRLLGFYKSDYIVERVLDQHQLMASLNPSSLNTVRLISYLSDKGVLVLSSVLRMGGAGSRTDNFSTGGVACGIDEVGKCKSVAYDQSYNKYEVHPNGTEFAGFEVPRYQDMVALVKKAHLKFGHFRIISWDIAIDKEGNLIVLEFNLTPQSIDFHQINNGPLFGDLTNEVIEEVLNGKSS